VAPDVSAPNALERIAAHGIAVDARAIEAEFDRIWQETESGDDTPGVRVRTLNLVAVGAEADDLERFEAVLQRLPVEHPCRAMFAIAAPPHERVTASISARCWPAATGRHVCSEEVVLAGAPAQEREIASAVLGLLVPELPLAVWVMGEEAATRELAARLMDAGDSAIIDTGRASDLRAVFASIVALSEEHDVRCLDLAWARLAGWRALLAQMFDGDAGLRELQQITQIAIRGGDGAPSSEAMLTAGWLASRLDFALADASIADGGIQASFYAGTRGVRLSVEPGRSALDAVTIRTTDAQFAIERDGSSGHLQVREVWDSGETQRVVEQGAQDDGSLIVLTLDGLGDSATFREAMETAMALMGA
jgi:glucose-6-phosphate dehydrogenase assembly protein OpcA